MADDKKGLFAPTPAPPEPADDKLNEVFARLRVDEQRSSELRKKMLFLEQNLLSNHRSAMGQIKSLQQDIVEAKRHIQEVEDRILTIIKELRLTARKEDMEVMRKYLELWNPVKFVTMETVERMINDKLNIPNKPLEPIKPMIVEKEIVEPIVHLEPEIEEPAEEVTEEVIDESEPTEEQERKSGEEKKSKPELQDSFEELVKKHEKGNV
jgi:hypothetical protein